MAALRFLRIISAFNARSIRSMPESNFFGHQLFPGPSRILFFVLGIKHPASGGVCHLARYWSRPSQAPRERSFSCKQDHYCDRCGYDRHRDKIEDCPTFAEVFKNLWKRQKYKVVSA